MSFVLGRCKKRRKKPLSSEEDPEGKEKDGFSDATFCLGNSSRRRASYRPSDGKTLERGGVAGQNSATEKRPGLTHQAPKELIFGSLEDQEVGWPQL